MRSRVLALAITLLAVFGLSRALVRWLPGDPIETLVAEAGVDPGSEQLRRELARELGLDRPWPDALARDLARASRGDFGRSLLTREPVAPLVRKHFEKTALLVVLAIAIGLALSLALGLAAAEPASRWNPGAYRASEALGALTAALPVAWTGPMLLYLLAVRLPLFPVSGGVVLPALALGISFSGLWCRLIRDRVRETLLRGSATGARARGVPELSVLWRHGFLPSAGFLVAYLGTQAGSLLSGAFLVEVLFDWPGMGTLLVRSVLGRDYPVVEAAVFVGALASLLGGFVGDLAQRWIDPRLDALEAAPAPGAATVSANRGHP
jgi:peptide/nickel transport system permease protein